MGSSRNWDPFEGPVYNGAVLTILHWGAIKGDHNLESYPYVDEYKGRKLQRQGVVSLGSTSAKVRWAY